MRQGNLNRDLGRPVEIIRYVTERSFDGYMWQTLERKAKFINQVMHGRLDTREITDIGDTALSYSEVKALATGNPLLMDKADADATLARLQRAERAHYRDQEALEYAIRHHEADIQTLTLVAADLDIAISRRQDTRGDAFTMTVGDRQHSKRAEAGQHLKDLIQRETAGLDGIRTRAVHAGYLGGFPLIAAVDRSLGKTTVSVTFDSIPGATVEMSAADLHAADPAGIVTRLENRLYRLEGRKTEAIAKIERARREITHARDSMGQPFPQAAQLAAARQRARDIDEELDRMAGPERTDEPPAGPGSPPGNGKDSQVGTGTKPAHAGPADSRTAEVVQQPRQTQDEDEEDGGSGPAATDYPRHRPTAQYSPRYTAAPTDTRDGLTHRSDPDVSGASPCDIRSPAEREIRNDAAQDVLPGPGQASGTISARPEDALTGLAPTGRFGDHAPHEAGLPPSQDPPRSAQTPRTPPVNAAPVLPRAYATAPARPTEQGNITKAAPVLNQANKGPRHAAQRAGLQVQDPRGQAQTTSHPLRSIDHPMSEAAVNATTTGGLHSSTRPTADQASDPRKPARDRNRESQEKFMEPQTGIAQAPGIIDASVEVVEVPDDIRFADNSRGPVPVQPRNGDGHASGRQLNPRSHLTSATRADRRKTADSSPRRATGPVTASHLPARQDSEPTARPPREAPRRPSSENAVDYAADRDHDLGNDPGRPPDPVRHGIRGAEARAPDSPGGTAAPQAPRAQRTRHTEVHISVDKPRADWHRRPLRQAESPDATSPATSVGMGRDSVTLSGRPSWQPRPIQPYSITPGPPQISDPEIYRLPSGDLEAGGPEAGR